MHRGDLSQRTSISDVNLQLAGIDAVDEAGELRGVAVDEDPLCTQPTLRILPPGRHGADQESAVCDCVGECRGLLR